MSKILYKLNLISEKKVFSFNSCQRFLYRLGLKFYKNKNYSIALLSIMVVVSFLLFFVLVNSYQYIGDDLIYMNIYGTENKVQSIKDILYSQYAHYFTWGGRSVAHFIVQTLLLVGKPLSSIMTTIVFLGLIYLTTIFTTKNRFFRTINILFIISLFYLVNPNFNDTVMWVTGAGNYLYTIFLVMVFIIPYAKFFDDVNYKKDRFFSIIFALYGIFVGWTNENTASALIGSLILILIYIKMKYKSVKLPVWAISGLLGLLLGFSL